MKKYVTDINLQDDNFFLYYNNGYVKSIPFLKTDKFKIQELIRIIQNEKETLEEVKKKFRKKLILNFISLLIILLLAIILSCNSNNTIITRIMTILSGCDLSIVNLIVINSNFLELNNIKKKLIPNIDNELDILNQDIKILEELEKKSKAIEFQPFYKKKILSNNLNTCELNYQSKNDKGKILVFKKR